MFRVYFVEQPRCKAVSPVKRSIQITEANSPQYSSIFHIYINGMFTAVTHSGGVYWVLVYKRPKTFPYAKQILIALLDAICWSYLGMLRLPKTTC